MKNKMKNEELFIASRDGGVAKVGTLLGDGADVNTRYHEDKTPLMVASQKGHVAVVRMLLENGANVIAKDMFGRNAFDFTSSRLIREALRDGMIAQLASQNMNERELREYCAFEQIGSFASLNDRLLWHVLTHAGAELAAWLALDDCWDDEEAPESNAALKGAYKAISGILTGNGDFLEQKIREFENKIAYQAMDARYFEMSPNIETFRYEYNIMTVFSRIGSIFTNDGVLSQEDVQFALDFVHYDYMEMYKGLMFLDRRAVPDILATRPENHIPEILLDAVGDGNERLIEILYNSVIDNDQNYMTRFFLMFASKKGDVNDVEMLMRSVNNARERAKYATDTLVYSVDQGHAEVVRVLIENGANVNAQDSGAWSPLAYAAHYGHLDVVRMLLENGANASDAIAVFTMTNIVYRHENQFMSKLLDGWSIVVALGSQIKSQRLLTFEERNLIKERKEIDCFVEREIKFQASLNNRLLLHVLAHAERLGDWLVLDARNEENVDVPESYAALKSAYKRISDEFAKEHFCVMAVRRFENRVRYRAIDAKYFEISPNTDLFIESTCNAAGVEADCLRIVKILSDNENLSLEDVQFALDFINHNYLGMVLDHIEDGMVVNFKKEDFPGFFALLEQEEAEEKGISAKIERAVNGGGFVERTQQRSAFSQGLTM